MLQNSDIIEFDATGEDIKQAKDELAKPYNRSLIKMVDVDSHEEAKLWGLVGQVIAGRYYQKKPFQSSTLNYDFVLAGKEVDVKTRHTSMRRQSQIRMEYRGMIRDDAVENQESEAYLFCLYNPSIRKVWLLGWITKSDFLKNAQHQEEGREYDDSNFKVRGNGWTIEYRYLRSASELRK